MSLIISIFFYLNSSKQIFSFQLKRNFASPNPPQNKIISIDKTIPPINKVADKQCLDLHEIFQSRSSLTNADQRFENTHKRIGEQIFRLRYFFKDGDEGEIPTYLVYQEDQEENAKIIEKSTYKKGPVFLKIEKAAGEIIYHEEGVNSEEDLFLHYINNKLIDVQGSNQNINCHF